MHLGLISVVVVAVASSVQAASLRFQRRQELKTIERLCEAPKFHAVDAKELVSIAASETVIPLQTILSRCDPDDDCCDGDFVRRAVVSDTRVITFLVTDAVSKDNERYINVTVEEHSKCKCVEQVTLVQENLDSIVESRR